MTTILPFELSTDAVTSWLQSLSKLNSVNSANQLNKAAKQLRAIQAESNELFNILIQLTPTVLFINTDIEQSVQIEMVKDSGTKSLKIEKLCLQLLGNLSLAFYSCSKSKALSADEKSVSMYFTLQFIGLAQRQSALFYQAPSSSLWEKTAEIYQTAKEHNVLEQDIVHKIKEFKQQPCIKTVIQRNCLFSLLLPNNYPHDQIKELFLITNKHSPLLDINTNADSPFSWSMTHGKAPSFTDKKHHNGSSTLSIDLNQFLIQLQSKNFSSSLNKDVLDSLVSKLSAYKKEINSALPSAFSINLLLTGFDNITEYLKKVEKLTKIQQISSQLTSATPNNSMSLEPMEFEKSHLKIKESVETLNQQNLTPANANPVKVLKTANEQFVIAESAPLEYTTGELALLYLENQSFELAIIRQKKTTSPPQATHILLERISGTPSFIQMSTPSIAESRAIVINNTQSVHLLVAPCKIPKGMQITSTTEKQYTLNKLVDYSPSFMNYTVY